MRPHDLGGGPSCDELRDLIAKEDLNDTEIARVYGVTRQTVSYWRRRCGISEPGKGHTRPRRRPRVSHKDLIPWTVIRRDRNHPIRKRLVEVSKLRQGVQMAPDETARAEEFLQMLTDLNVVVDYDPLHLAGGEPAPFFFRPRDPKLDGPEDIIRRDGHKP